MTTRVAINPDRIGVNEAWEYYETLRAAIVQSIETTKQNLTNGTAPYNPKLFGMNLKELDAYSKDLLDEADKQACLFLIASAEASLHVDFLSRVYRYKKQKDSVSRTFQRIYKKRGKKIRVEKDILNTWSSEFKAAKAAIDAFKTALQLRHWLAHGRYWEPKKGWFREMNRKYDAGGVALIIQTLFQAIEVPASN